MFKLDLKRENTAVRGTGEKLRTFFFFLLIIITYDFKENSPVLFAHIVAVA